MSSTNQTNLRDKTLGNDMDCSMCLSAIERRGGVPMISPGCCGSFFHKSCVDALIKSGNISCPNCRVEFSGAILPTPVLVPRPLPPSPQLPPRLQHRMHGRPSFGSSILSACEELLDRADPLLGSLPIEVGEGLSSIGIEVTPERNAMTTQDSANFFVNITLKANGLAERTKRTPLDIVCVLDNSGSMSGAKFQSLKEAMRYVRSQLTPDDRLSIVTFNHDASVLHGLMKMSDNNRTASEAALDGVQAQGGTDIFSGLSCAEAILQSRQTMNTLSCVFLLTDGQDGSRQQEKADLARRLKALGQSLYVFGFGNDHDSAQLQTLANAAEGPFTYVESDDVVVDAFGGALGGQQGVIGKDIKLTITMAETEGLTVLECVSGRYSSVVSRDRKSVVVSFANIFGGEQRDVLLKLCVPSCESEVAKYDLLHARVSYKTVNDEAREGLWCPSAQVATIMSSPAVEIPQAESSTESMPEDSSSTSSLPSIAPNRTVAVCSVRRVAMLSPEDEAQVSVAVDVQKNRHLVTTSIADALRRADGRDLATARASVTAVLAMVQASVSFTAGHPMTLAQVEDLNEALEKLHSEQRYFAAGGRHAMCETMETMGAQRCVYSKANKMVSPYQTPTSSAMQSDAKSKKATPSPSPLPPPPTPTPPPMARAHPRDRVVGAGAGGGTEEPFFFPGEEAMAAVFREKLQGHKNKSMVLSAVSLEGAITKAPWKALTDEFSEPGFESERAKRFKNSPKLQISAWLRYWTEECPGVLVDLNGIHVEGEGCSIRAVMK